MPQNSSMQCELLTPFVLLYLVMIGEPKREREGGERGREGLAGIMYLGKMM